MARPRPNRPAPLSSPRPGLAFRLPVVAFEPISTYAREVYDIRQGLNVFSFKHDHPSLEMIGSLRRTEHGFLPLVYVRGAGVPALGEDGRPFVYRLRHVDPQDKSNFDTGFKEALAHLVTLMQGRAEDVPLRQDRAQIDAVLKLIQWADSLSSQVEPPALASSTSVPLIAPLQAYAVETYDLNDAEIVTLAANDSIYLDCRIIETPRGFLPASHLQSEVVGVDARAQLQPSGDSIMIPPGADAPAVSAIISDTGAALLPTPFYADPQEAAVAAVLDLQRTARSLWYMSGATEEERASVERVHTWAKSLDPLQSAQEFMSQRDALTGPPVF